MNGSLRPHASSWRRAATVVLAAGWARPSPAVPSLPPEGFRLLLLQRSGSQGFMPGAHVFPGGVQDTADRSADWLRLFAPHHRPPRFGLGPARSRPASFPGLPAAAADGDAAALPDDVASRICAIRETFEEAGVALLRPRAALQRRPSCPGPRAATGPGRLASTRSARDPRHFLRPVAHLTGTPRIWALHDWRAWLIADSRAPAVAGFDTPSFVCCRRNRAGYPDLTEVVSSPGTGWSSPSEATESFISKEIWLAPPQFYEIRRLGNFSSLSDLHKFCLDGASEGMERMLPITFVTADAMLQLLPGDELYLEDSEFLETVMSSGKKTEEIMKEGKTFHRLVLHSRHVYNLHVTIQSKYKHVYPKTYVISKSHL
uniref:Acyl-coenzyme A diphosphatase NUDT19 n=1 Tax=Ursus americanus TaxID=9643 RepID=A0A452QSZ6_URSAM